MLVPCLIFAVLALAWILFPVGGNTKEAAKRTQCLSNIKRSVLALSLYATDHDDRLPPSNDWMDAIATQIGPEDMPSCSALWVNGKPKGYGYAMNRFVSGQRLSKDVQIPLVYESTQTKRNASGYLLDMPNPGRHGGRNNVGFMDGHVKSLPLQAAR